MSNILFQIKKCIVNFFSSLTFFPVAGIVLGLYYFGKVRRFLIGRGGDY